MMAHKGKGNTTYRIDRVFAGVGRIALASGTSHAGTFGRVNAMLTGLDRIGRIDLLLAIRDRMHAPLVVLHYYERGQLEKLPSAETAAGLLVALWAFQTRHECGPSYRADLGTSIRHIATVATKASSVADLPKLVRALKERMRGTPVAFNRLRTHMMAFASDIQGKHAPLWVEVVRVNRFKKAEGARPRSLQRRPLTVRELDLVCAAFVDHSYRRGNAKRESVISADTLARMTTALALSGMRPKEYWEREDNWWEDRGMYLWTHGTKTPAAKRPTFRIVPPFRAGCGEQFFRRKFSEATTKALRVGLDAYSLRRTFAKLCEDAGVVTSRREAYMGHGPKTVSDTYLQTNILPFVQADTALVIRWMASERAAATRPLQLESIK